jgi:hypothetical protein
MIRIFFALLVRLECFPSLSYPNLWTDCIEACVDFVVLYHLNSVAPSS